MFINRRIVTGFALMLLAMAPLFAAQKMAVITKARGDVMIKSAADNKFSKSGKIGTVLEDGDAVKTGSDGFSVIVFLDDKSQVKLYNSCTLEIRGEKQNGALTKSMAMGFGKLKAEVAKQVGGAQFKIATPTSVASVKGTEFWMISDESNGDQIIGLSGLVQLLNQVSGQSVMVASNQTGVSMPGGDVNVSVTSPESIPDEEEGADDSTPNQLRFQYQDSDGNLKEVIIDYR